VMTSAHVCKIKKMVELPSNSMTSMHAGRSKHVIVNYCEASTSSSNHPPHIQAVHENRGPAKAQVTPTVEEQASTSSSSAPSPIPNLSIKTGGPAKATVKYAISAITFF
jgi:hypothetical protein